MHASQERSRERILTQADPARVRKSRDAVVLKEGSTFLVATESGDVPFRRPHGFGIFFKDCRFLDGYELSVNSTTPTVLSGLSVRARVRDLPPFDQPQAARQERPCVHPSEHDRDPAPEAHSRRSRARAPVGPELRARPCAPAHRDLTWRATFEDIFVVKGFVRHAKGTPRRPQVQDDDHVELGYEGTDKVIRTTTIAFSPTPQALQADRTEFGLEVSPGHGAEITITPAERTEGSPGREFRVAEAVLGCAVKG